MIHNHEVGRSFLPLATKKIKHLHIQPCRCFLFCARFVLGLGLFCLNSLCMKPSFGEMRFEISNLILIIDMDIIVKLSEVIITLPDYRGILRTNHCLRQGIWKALEIHRVYHLSQYFWTSRQMPGIFKDLCNLAEKVVKYPTKNIFRSQGFLFYYLLMLAVNKIRNSIFLIWRTE